MTEQVATLLETRSRQLADALALGETQARELERLKRERHEHVRRYTDAKAQLEAAARRAEQARRELTEAQTELERSRRDAETARSQAAAATTTARAELATATAELIANRQRLEAAAAEIESLRVQLTENQQAPSPGNHHDPTRHLLFLADRGRYRLLERSGPAPEQGSIIALETKQGPVRYLVARTTTGPLPDRHLLCAYLDPL